MVSACEFFGFKLVVVGHLGPVLLQMASFMLKNYFALVISYAFKDSGGDFSTR